MLPRDWRAAWGQLRRDVTMVSRRLAGHPAPPLIRSPSSSRAPASPSVARAPSPALDLQITRVVRETADAVTLVLQRTDEAPFEFLAGQFFTILTELDGEIVPRNYSASNAPGDKELHLTIKRKPGGRVSGALTSSRAGDRVRVLGPFGSFVLDASAKCPRRLVLVAGGSGITPLASIARTVLATEPSAEIAIVYANRREEDVILATELDALARAHADRLSIVHVLEDRSTGSELRGETGRLDRVTAACVFGDVPLASDPEASFYVCGPDPMREEVLAALAARGVSPDAVKVERFAIGPRPQPTTSSPAAPRGARVAIRVKGSTHRTSVLPGATLLEAGLAAGAPMPFSCGVGGCGACRVRVIEGEVEVDEPNCLSEAERKGGYVLACVGRPVGPAAVEVSVEE